MWPITLSGRLLIVDLVSRYLTNYLIRREPTSYRISLTPVSCGTVVLCGISTCFQVLSPCMRQVAHALLTRSPLSYIRASSPATPFDLHVLSTPPAFVLSQDQTLVFNPFNLVFWFPRPTSKTHSRINCRSFLILCIVFKVRCSPVPFSFRIASRSVPDDNITFISTCQPLFSNFFHFFSNFFEKNRERRFSFPIFLGFSMIIFSFCGPISQPQRSQSAQSAREAAKE